MKSFDSQSVSEGAFTVVPRNVPFMQSSVSLKAIVFEPLKDNRTVFQKDLAPVVPED